MTPMHATMMPGREEVRVDIRNMGSQSQHHHLRRRSEEVK
jgi:hypothetical protein